LNIYSNYWGISAKKNYWGTGDERLPYVVVSIAPTYNLKQIDIFANVQFGTVEII
jgi:hypothetical protein